MWDSSILGLFTRMRVNASKAFGGVHGKRRAEKAWRRTFLGLPLQGYCQIPPLLPPKKELSKSEGEPSPRRGLIPAKLLDLSSVFLEERVLPQTTLVCKPTDPDY